MNVNFMNELKQHTKKTNEEKKIMNDTMEYERDEWQWLWNNCNYFCLPEKVSQAKKQCKKKRTHTSKKLEKIIFRIKENQICFFRVNERENP